MLQFEPGKAPITLTEAAVKRAKYLIDKNGDEKILGLRVGVKSTGCSGLSYFVEYATEQKKFEDRFGEKIMALERLLDAVTVQDIAPKPCLIIAVPSQPV